MLHVLLRLGAGHIRQLQARSKSHLRLWMVMAFPQESFRHAGLPLFGRLMRMVEETDWVSVQELSWTYQLPQMREGRLEVRLAAEMWGEMRVGEEEEEEPPRRFPG